MKHRYWILFCVILVSLGTFGCGDDITKKYISATEPVGTLDEPTGEEGNFVLSMAGGEGTDGYGGNGGQLQLNSYSNTGIYKKTRSLETDFTVPIPDQDEDLGDTGATISSDMTIPVDPSETTAGDLYMLSGDLNLYRALSEGSEVVTGLKVEAGVTVTLELNYDWNSDGVPNYEAASLQFAEDVIIEGTLATDDLFESGELRHGAAATARDKGSLYLDVDGRFVMAEDSLLDTAGDDGTGSDRGGDGGYIQIFTANGNGLLLQGTIDASGGDGLGTGIGGNGPMWANTSIGWVYLDSDDEEEPGSLINTGMIDASGGDGSSGGDAGGIELDSEWQVYNTGTLYSNGGLGSTGSGGNGYEIYMEPDGGSLFNSGDLHVEGGDGATGGGDSGDLYLYSADENMGDLINTGDIYVHGGDATGENGNGGDGADYIDFYNYGGKLVTTGDIFGDGGDGAGEGSGGDAVDYFYVYCYEGSDFGFGEYASPGLIQITGDISLNGGSGYYGGNGCYSFYVENSYSDGNFPPVYPVEFLGYTTVDLTGGKATTDGGDGGDLYIYTYTAWYGDDYTAYPTGAIANRADILAAGGEGGIYTGTVPMENGYGGFGGEGGTIEFETYDSSYPAYFGTTVVLNSGDLDVSGGKGTDGGNSGYVYLYGHDYVENTGTIRVMGGEAAGSGGNGGIGAFGGESGIEIYATFDIMNSGNIIATGGAGTGTAADGGGCYELYMIAGRQVTNSGDIYMNGGYGDYGGHGGLAVIGSETTATDNSGMITVAGGVGSDDSDGDDGAIWIDGFVLTSGDETGNDG